MTKSSRKIEKTLLKYAKITKSNDRMIVALERGFTMKKTTWKRLAMGAASIALCGCMLCTSVGTEIVDAKETQAEETEGKTVNLAFLHDLHSYLDSYKTEVDGEEKLIGGVARIQTLINEQKEQKGEVLVVDAGDFSMGTLYQTIFKEEAVELRILGALGVEATTIGNHEFDYRASGYYDMFESALASGDPLPQFLLCNVDWEGMEMTNEQQLYADCFADYGVKDYTVIEKGGVKIALFGLFGKDALACAPTCDLEFENPIEAAKETVAEIKANEDVDMIVALSHSGTSTVSESEDEELAKAVGDIDVIISGHSHTVLEEPIVYGDTIIVSCGCYGEYLGTLTMEGNADGRWDMTSYELIPVTEDIPEDEGIKEKLAGFSEDVDRLYLSNFGYTSDQVIAYNPYEFSTVDDLYDDHTEQNLGSIIADAYIYATKQAEGDAYEKVDVAVVPSGTIRGTYTKGDVTVADVFNSFSLGTGADGKPGYPLISVYLTGEELMTMCEVDASVSEFMTSARLFVSGLNFTFNPNRMILNKVTDLELVNEDGSTEEIDPDRLYRVVADLYSGQMLGAVSDQSMGILSVTPKYADGTPIEDFEDVIIYDGGQEVKAWVGIAQYLSSFDKNADGVSQIPERYASAEGRKVVDDSTNLVDLVKNPNKTTIIIVIAIVVIIVILVLLIILLVKLGKKVAHRIRKK